MSAELKHKPEDAAASGSGQDAFARAVLDPGAALPADLAAGPTGAPPSKRFAVYRNNVVVGLVSALAAGFPTVKKLVGEAFFNAMAAEHARAHPPVSPVMIFYGEAFPDWLEGFPPAARAPYLADVARLERARRESYHAQDATPLDAGGFQAAMAQLPAEAQAGARLRLHPAHRIIRSDHPIFSIWSEVNGHGAIPDRGPQNVLVARPEGDLVMRLLAPGTAAFLAALTKGEPLGVAAAQAEDAAATRAAAFDFAAALGLGLETGVFVGVEA